MDENRDKPEPLWTADQVAAYVGVHVQTVYSKAASGEIVSLKVGRGLRFRPSDIEEWLEAQPSPAEATS